MKPFVSRLSKLLGINIKIANNCTGEEVEKLLAETPERNVLLLQNVSCYKEEEKNDPMFAKKPASLAYMLKTALVLPIVLVLPLRE